MKDGAIVLDSELGKQIGFVSDKFEGYLWKNDNVIWISFIISKVEGKGNLRQLFNNILVLGYDIKVPTPSLRMENICKRLGFQPHQEEVIMPDGTKEWVDLMYKESEKKEKE